MKISNHEELWIPVNCILLTTFFFQSENNRVLVNIYLQRKERILQSENKIPISALHQPHEHI